MERIWLIRLACLALPVFGLGYQIWCDVWRVRFRWCSCCRQKIDLRRAIRMPFTRRQAILAYGMGAPALLLLLTIVISLVLPDSARPFGRRLVENGFFMLVMLVAYGGLNKWRPRGCPLCRERLVNLPPRARDSSWDSRPDRGIG